MKSCTWFKRVEVFLDGESGDARAIEAHLADCTLCVAHRDSLLQWRAALHREAPVLTDAQFPAFMEGISAGIQQHQPRTRGFWALTSLVTAALVIALATFSIFGGSTPEPVRANEVESATSEIDGATVQIGNSGGGVTTIWISITEDDV